jgi:hypothetical protein
MAKGIPDGDLLKALRTGDLRKRVTQEVSKYSPLSDGKGKAPKEVRDVIKNLRQLADDLEDRVTGGSKKRRQEAARKAARTRQRNAKARSAAARKGARTRAKA